MKDREYFEKPGGVYDPIIPVLTRDGKAKFWEPNHLKWHRLEGPAVIGRNTPTNNRPEVEWFFKGKEIDQEVYSWCDKRGVDPLDLEEHEALMMWIEVDHEF